MSSPSVGSWAGTAVDSQLVAADTDRGTIILQHHSGDEIFIGIGTAGVVDKGIKVSSDIPLIMLEGFEATQEIRGICNTAESAAGGFQEL